MFLRLTYNDPPGNTVRDVGSILVNTDEIREVRRDRRGDRHGRNAPNAGAILVYRTGAELYVQESRDTVQQKMSDELQERRPVVTVTCTCNAPKSPSDDADDTASDGGSG